MSKPKQEIKNIEHEINKHLATIVADSVGVQKKTDGIQLSFFCCILENLESAHFMEQSRVRLSDINAKDLIDHLAFHADYYPQKENVSEKFNKINNIKT